MASNTGPDSNQPFTRFLAVIALVTLATSNQLAYFWYGFGLWPQSWIAFWLFGIGFTVCVRWAWEILDGEKGK